jgi:hypothetical protein
MVAVVGVGVRARLGWEGVMGTIPEVVFGLGVSMLIGTMLMVKAE